MQQGFDLPTIYSYNDKDIEKKECNYGVNDSYISKMELNVKNKTKTKNNTLMIKTQILFYKISILMIKYINLVSY